MYFLMSYCIVVIFYIQMVSSQVELKRVSPPPFDCGSSLKLICKYSGLAACCSADTRVWRRNNTQIMNNGVESSTTGKYAEFIDLNQKSFELTITNIGASDFGINYVCEYGFDASTPLKLKDTHLRCGNCPKCGGRCFGWGCLATLWANYSMMVGIFILIWRDHEDGEDETTNSEDSCCKRFLHDGYFIALISTLLSAAIAIPIGLHYCICYDFGDDAYLYYPDPSFISVGYLVVISTLLMMKCFKCKDLNCKDVCILIGIIITCPFGPILYSAYIFKYVKMKTWKDVGFKDILLVLSGVIAYGIAVFLLCKDWPTEEENNPKKKTQETNIKLIPNCKKASVGSDICLVCPYKAVDKKKITWHKIDDGKAVRYSEGEVINPNLKLKSRLKVTGQHQDGNGEYHLSISNVQHSDEGTYECSLSGTAGAVCRQQLTVSGGNNEEAAV